MRSDFIIFFFLCVCVLNRVANVKNQPPNFKQLLYDCENWIVSKKLLRQLESFHSACQDTGEEVMLFKEIGVRRWE